MPVTASLGWVAHRLWAMALCLPGGEFSLLLLVLHVTLCTLSVAKRIFQWKMCFFQWRFEYFDFPPGPSLLVEIQVSYTPENITHITGLWHREKLELLSDERGTSATVQPPLLWGVVPVLLCSLPSSACSCHLFFCTAANFLLLPVFPKQLHHKRLISELFFQF